MRVRATPGAALRRSAALDLARELAVARGSGYATSPRRASCAIAIRWRLRGARSALLLVAALAVLARPAPAAAQGEPAPHGAVVRVEHRPAGAAPALGLPDSPVYVELFFLPGATSTRSPYQLATELWRNHPKRVRVIFRVLARQGQVHLPVATLEAAAQGKFFAFMDAIIGSLRGTSPAQIREVARGVGMDVERLEAAWLDNRYLDELDGNEQRRARLRTRQTPEVLFSGKLASRPVSVLGSADFEAAYREAYDRALDALDRGVPADELAATLEQEALDDRLAQMVGMAPTDEPSGDELAEEPSTNLLAYPVRVAGLPTWRSSKPAAPGPEPRRVAAVLVACNPLSVLCHRQLQIATAAAGILEGQVRVRWAPMFDARADDAATATLASDAILCAESMGLGWTALDLMTMRTNVRRGRPIEANAVIDHLIDDADLDRATLARCLAVMAGDSARRATELRERGVAVTPTLVVGGRMYPGGVSDVASMQNLIQLELAEGWLGRASPRR